jgi:hypothetical protein
MEMIAEANTSGPDGGVHEPDDHFSRDARHELFSLGFVSQCGKLEQPSKRLNLYFHWSFQGSFDDAPPKPVLEMFRMSLHNLFEEVDATDETLLSI